MKDFLKNLFHGWAWVLVIIGLLMFSARIPLPADGWVNLPVAITVFQTAGLLFTLCGLQMIASAVFWPLIRVRELMREVLEENSTAAALVLLGLLLFNGLSLIALANWLVHALGAGVSAG